MDPGRGPGRRLGDLSQVPLPRMGRNNGPGPVGMVEAALYFQKNDTLYPNCDPERERDRADLMIEILSQAKTLPPSVPETIHVLAHTPLRYEIIGSPSSSSPLSMRRLRLVSTEALNNAETYADDLLRVPKTAISKWDTSDDDARGEEKELRRDIMEYDVLLGPLYIIDRRVRRVVNIHLRPGVYTVEGHNEAFALQGIIEVIIRRVCFCSSCDETSFALFPSRWDEVPVCIACLQAGSVARLRTPRTRLSLIDVNLHENAKSSSMNYSKKTIPKSLEWTIKVKSPLDNAMKEFPWGGGYTFAENDGTPQAPCATEYGSHLITDKVLAPWSWKAAVEIANTVRKITPDEQAPDEQAPDEQAPDDTGKLDPVDAPRGRKRLRA